MTAYLTRRSFFAVGAAATAVGLAACGNNSESKADASSTPVASGKGMHTRSADGFHLNSKIEAPTVVLYSDFQCPYCAKADVTYAKVAQELDGIMNVTVKNFPLPMHANAIPAALAVEAAQAQGKHVEMAEKIFKNQDAWKTLNSDKAREVFAGYAKELSLDLQKFSADAESEEALNVIKTDFDAGRNAGVSGTPQWVIGGKPLDNVDSSYSKGDMVAAFKKAAGI